MGVEKAGRPASLPAVIAISSHVIRGSVGNRSIVFALEALGFPVWSVPTVTLPWHPGHGPATRIVPEVQDFEDLLNDLSNAPWLGEVGAVLSGYLASAEQAEAVSRLVAKVKSTNQQALYLCDPVIGDEGGLYVDEATARAVSGLLLPAADIMTPNRFELSWLSGGASLLDNSAIIAACRKLDCATALTTSAHANEMHGSGSLLTLKGEKISKLAEHASIQNPPNGPGDLTSALFLAHLLKGDTPVGALKLTTASVLDILLLTTRRGADELALESGLEFLLQPRSEIVLSNVIFP